MVLAGILAMLRMMNLGMLIRTMQILGMTFGSSKGRRYKKHQK
jgi:hypothetical protein